MTMRTSGIIAGYTGADFVSMKERLTEYQRQLGSGKRSETFGGLGEDRGRSLNLRSAMSELSSWRQSITTATTRISLVDQALDSIQSSTSEARGAMTKADYTLADGRTNAQYTARGALDSVISALQQTDGGRYLFGGRQTSSSPVADREVMMNGEGGRDGFMTVMRERLQADLGSASSSPERDGSATGRLTLSAPSAQPVTLAEDGVHDFGLKIGGVSGAVGGLNATVASGPPASLSIAAGTGIAKAGETLSLSFELPDGTTETVTLTAAAADANPLPENSFRIGATPADTLTNVREALGQSMSRLVAGPLAAASNAKAGDDFFAGETDPARLAGSPAVEPGAPKRIAPGPSGGFADAVVLDSASAGDARTVRWYRGDRSSGDPRATASAQIDSSVRISYGVRADEKGLRETIQHLAVASAATFAQDDPEGMTRHRELMNRVGAGLGEDRAAQGVTAIRMQVASASSSAKSAEERHKTTDAMLVDFLADVEGVNDEEVAAYIVALDTNLQASYQTSSILSQLTLVDYLR